MVRILNIILIWYQDHESSYAILLFRLVGHYKLKVLIKELRDSQVKLLHGEQLVAERAFGKLVGFDFMGRGIPE